MLDLCVIGQHKHISDRVRVQGMGMIRLWLSSVYRIIPVDTTINIVLHEWAYNRTSKGLEPEIL